jgi:homoserine kinase
MRPRTVTVHVPASTSNLGSGFDTLGLALRLYNRVEVTHTSKPGLHILDAPSTTETVAVGSLAEPVVERFFRQTRQKPFGVSLSQRSEIPVGRGLGASAALRVGVAAGLNALTGSPLDRQQLLNLVTEIEGHPDNTAPAILGGFTASTIFGKEARTIRFPVSPKAKFITLIPNFEVSTPMARKLVPQQFSKADTVHSLTRVAVITAAFASGNLEALRGCFDDRIHQPYRESLIPQLSRVIRAGELAGAIGGWLSGSGSAIICLALQNEAAVAHAMRCELPESTVHILRADRQGMTGTSIKKRSIGF